MRAGEGEHRGGCGWRGAGGGVRRSGRAESLEERRNGTEECKGRRKAEKSVYL